MMYEKKIPFLDLSIKNESILLKNLKSLEKVFRHGRIILGPEVIKLEKAIAEKCSMKYSLGVNSGSSALFIALKSLGINEGDEIITTPLSWIATFHAISLCGAIPVCCDINDDLNIDCSDIENSITNKTKAILPVHYSGLLCDMKKIITCSKDNNLFVIEDAAQAFGSSYFNNSAGSFGDINCFSMNPMKNLNAYGEAGCILTNNKNLFDICESLRYSGTIDREKAIHKSLNFRIDTIQAALLLNSLKLLPEKIKRRRINAKLYNERLSEVVTCPIEPTNYYHSYYNYIILSNERDLLQKYLFDNGVETKIHHPILMPDQPIYKNLKKPNIPNARKLVKRILSLPIHENLKRNDINYISDKIISFYRNL